MGLSCTADDEREYNGKNGDFMRKRLITTFAAIALTVEFIAASVRYYHFATQTIYTASAAHLAEIYHQVNQSLHSLVGRSWGAMHMWISLSCRRTRKRFWMPWRRKTSAPG